MTYDIIGRARLAAAWRSTAQSKAWGGDVVVVQMKNGAFAVVPTAIINDSAYVGSRVVVARFVNGKQVK
jgi:hypothetical protein